MGILDVPDDAIKADKLYLGAKKEIETFNKVLEKWKTEWAGSESRLADLGKALKSAFKETDKAMKKFPDFAEFGKMRGGLVEVAKALNEKFPTHTSLKNYDIKTAAENPDHRFI